MSPADRSHSGGSTKGERLSAKMRSLPVPSEPYESSAPKELGEKRSPFTSRSPVCSRRDLGSLCCSLCHSPPADAFYVDPLGPQMERPKTGAKKRLEDDDFEDEVLGDDLLPE